MNEGKRGRKKGAGTLKKGFNVIIDEVEFLIFLSIKKRFLALRSKYIVFISQINLIIFLSSLKFAEQRILPRFLSIMFELSV